MAITKDDVKKAYLELLADNKNPTITRIREHLGTGSNTTISAHRKEILAELDAEKRPPELVDTEALASEIIEAITELAGRLKADVDKTVEADIKKLNDDIEDLNIKLELAAELEEKITLDLQHANERKEIAEKLTAEAQAEKLELLEINATLREKVSSAQSIVDDKNSEINTLKNLHEKSREQLEHYRKSVEVSRQQEVERHEGQVAVLANEIRQFKMAAARQQEMNIQAASDYSRLEASCEAKSEQIASLEAKVLTLDNKLKESTYAKAKADAELELTNSRLLAIKRELQDCKTTNNKLSVKLKSLTDRENKNEN